MILYGGLQDIPEELYEAASLDGASGWQRFRYITWPLLRPVVSVVLVLGLVYTIKVFDVIMGLTGGGPANATQTLATRPTTCPSAVRLRAGRRARQHADRRLAGVRRRSTCVPTGAPADE